MKAGSVSSVSLDEINARARDSCKPRTANHRDGFSKILYTRLVCTDRPEGHEHER